jgi:hypothetical protein
MQFGLCNAPSTFQHMVDDVLRAKKDSSYVDMYIDDILVHMENEEDNQY